MVLALERELLVFIFIESNEEMKIMLAIRTQRINIFKGIINPTTYLKLTPAYYRAVNQNSL